MFRFAIAIYLLACASALAQQQPDPDFLQKALAVVQKQRNDALDGAAFNAAQAAQLAEENAKLKAQVDLTAKKNERSEP